MRPTTYLVCGRGITGRFQQLANAPGPRYSWMFHVKHNPWIPSGVGGPCRTRSFDGKSTISSPGGPIVNFSREVISICSHAPAELGMTDHSDAHGIISSNHRRGTLLQAGSNSPPGQEGRLEGGVVAFALQMTQPPSLCSLSFNKPNYFKFSGIETEGVRKEQDRRGRATIVKLPATAKT